MNTNKAVNGLSAIEMAEYLDTEEATAEYLNQVLADYKEGDLAEALGCIAKARGITEIVKASGLTREELYKALMPDSQLSLDTIQRVCMGLGLKLGVMPT
jgi:probable addiction module antidote protein